MYFLIVYTRLMPACMFILMFYSGLYRHVFVGPFEPPTIADAENCRVNWWTNLLMISNLVNTNKQVCVSTMHSIT